LETIAQTGTTTLLHVTHDPSEALSCEKHILELHPNEEPMFRIIETEH
jgi:molybdate transport system ATP-binding protein